jgi:diacylglycerol kinase family enzyme
VTDHVLLVNGDAGSADRQAVAAAGEVLATTGAVRTVETDAPDDLDDLLGDLDDEVLVVCGGDGSVHLAVDRLRAHGRLDVPLGLVPLGTGNDLAQGLGLPLEPDDAAERIRDGAPRDLDLLVADDGTICVNALHAGIGVDAAERAQALKAAIGPVAYPLGAVAAGVTAPGWDVAVEVDGRRLEPAVGGAVLLVAVMNLRTFGGGTPMAPEAEPDDGALDVVVTTATGPAARAAFGNALRKGTHHERDDVAAARGRTVTIRGEAIGYNVDGELDGEEFTSRTWTVEPGVWRLVV